MNVPKDPAVWQKVEAILRAALELPPTERSSFLDRACAGDSALRSEVEALLAAAADAAAGDFLGQPARWTSDLLSAR